MANTVIALCDQKIRYFEKVEELFAKRNPPKKEKV